MAITTKIIIRREDLWSICLIVLPPDQLIVLNKPEQSRPGFIQESNAVF
ncbi:MAG: hypothetical protein QME42_06670 [bacterium]|nr:hypothetical protein [bacterium]